MNALAVVLVAATFAVDYGWTARDTGGVEYIIQIEPELAEALRSGELPEGVASEIVPQVQNVRAFRIVIGEDDLPRDDLPESTTSTNPATPDSSLLAADTAPDLRTRYGFNGGDANPRYAQPPSEVGSSKEIANQAAENLRNSTNQAVNEAANNTANQLQNEASRLRQQAEENMREGVQNLGNALRGDSNQNGQTNQNGNQPGLNPAANNSGGNNPNAQQYASQAGNGNSRFAPNANQLDANGNPVNSSQQPNPNQYGQNGGSAAASGPPPSNRFQNSNQWQQNGVNGSPQAANNPGNYANQPALNGAPNQNQNNWQAGNPAANAQQQQAYQNQAYQNQAPQQPAAWQGQQAPAQQQSVPYRNPPRQQAPQLHPASPYLNGQYAAGNPAWNQPPPGNGNVNVQPVSQPNVPAIPQPPANNGQPTTVARNSIDHDHGAQQPTANQSPANQREQETSASKPENPSSHHAPQLTSDSKADPGTVAWVAMWLLLLSISGNLFLGYIASNFQKQTRKMAMQLRRARSH